MATAQQYVRASDGDQGSIPNHSLSMTTIIRMGLGTLTVEEFPGRPRRGMATQRVDRGTDVGYLRLSVLLLVPF